LLTVLAREELTLALAAAGAELDEVKGVEDEAMATALS
jgi:hypothetical protein